MSYASRLSSKQDHLEVETPGPAEVSNPQRMEASPAKAAGRHT